MNEKDRNTSTKPRLVTAEAVRAGHPDKFCDQFADMLLGESVSYTHLTLPTNSRV